MKNVKQEALFSGCRRKGKIRGLLDWTGLDSDREKENTRSVPSARRCRG